MHDIAKKEDLLKYILSVSPASGNKLFDLYDEASSTIGMTPTTVDDFDLMLETILFESPQELRFRKTGSMVLH